MSKIIENHYGRQMNIKKYGIVNSVNTLLSKKFFSICTILLLALAVPTSSFAEINNIQDAINKSGKQRMLTQRMLRDYAMIGMNMDYSNPKEDLGKITAQFDTAIQELKEFKVNDEVSKSLSDVESLWAPIKKTLSQAPQKESMTALQESMEGLLKACHKTTVLITDSTGEKSSEIINLSGRQRMLSQRLASLYMIKSWGIDDPMLDQTMTQVLSDFSAAQQKLESSPLSTPEIQKELVNVKKNFQWFEMMGKKKSKKFIPSLIARSSDKILVSMDAATNMYANNK